MFFVVVVVVVFLVFLMMFRLFIATIYLVVTDWETADLLVLVGDVYCICVTFPCGILGQVWYLIASLPDFCLLSYFDVDPIYVSL